MDFTKNVFATAAAAGLLASSVSASAALVGFDFSTDLSATSTVLGVASASLSANGASVSTDIDTSDNTITNGTYLVANGALHTKRNGWTEWAGAASSNTTGPFEITITASSDYDLTVTGLTVVANGNLGGFDSSNNLFVAFHQDSGVDGSQESFGLSPAGDFTTKTSVLSGPVVIGAGTSQTFNVRLASNGAGAAASQHVYDSFQVEGFETLVPEPGSLLLAGFGFPLVVMRSRKQR